MIDFTSQTGVWSIDAETTELPAVRVSELQPGQRLKVTCQFLCRTMTDDLSDGFQYHVVEQSEVKLITLTPDAGLVQGSDSWQLYTHITLFEVPLHIEGDVTLGVKFSRSGMNGQGSMMNYTLLVERL